MSDTNIKYLAKVKLPVGNNESSEEFELADKYLRNEFKQLNTIVTNIVYPIGSVYWTSDKTFNPNEKFGGKWVRITNTFIYAANDSDTVCGLKEIGSSKYKDSSLISNTQFVDTNLLGSSEGKEGSSTKQITIENMPEHDHDVIDNGHEHKITVNEHSLWNGIFGGDGIVPTGNDYTEKAYSKGIKALTSTSNIKIGNRGGGEPLDIMPPYLYRYCWERTE